MGGVFSFFICTSIDKTFLKLKRPRTQETQKPIPPSGHTRVFGCLVLSHRSSSSPSNLPTLVQLSSKATLKKPKQNPTQKIKELHSIPPTIQENTRVHFQTQSNNVHPLIATFTFQRHVHHQKQQSCSRILTKTPIP